MALLRLSHRSQPRTIQFWLTLLVAVCILPSAIGAAIVLVRTYERDRVSLETARIGVARALMQAVDNELAGAASVLHVLADSPLLASGDLAAFQAQATEAVKNTSGNNVVLSLPDGTQAINTLKPFGSPLPEVGDAESQRRTIESGGLVISGVFVGPVANQPLVVIRLPVILDGRIKYTLGIAFSSKRLGNILLRQRMPAGWVAALYDQHGVVAARTLGADQFVGRPGAAETVHRVAQVPEGALVTYNLEGKPVHATFSRSASSGWAVVIAVPAAVAAAELRHSLGLDGAGAAAALLLGVVLARHFARRIARSLTALVGPALALGLGEPVALPPSDIIEVDALRTALLKTGRLIEQRARERDAARDAEQRMVVSTQAAEQASRAKSVFLASVSHELRTPLHGILGYAELLALEGGLTQKQAQRLRAMQSAGQHLLGMINAVLDMSQIEADQIKLHPEEIDLSELVDGCLDVVRPAAAAKAVALQRTPPAPLRVRHDPMRLRQVLINLLGNAVKFTPTGMVEVRLQPTSAEAPTPEGSVRLEVVDTGPGIPPQHRDRLFRTFERIDFKAVSGIEGAGLGLAIAARLVHLMGGKIGYLDNPGGGSVFWLQLPGQDAAAPMKGTAASAALDSHWQTGLHRQDS